MGFYEVNKLFSFSYVIRSVVHNQPGREVGDVIAVEEKVNWLSAASARM